MIQLTPETLKAGAEAMDKALQDAPPPYYVYLHSTWESELLGLPDSVKVIYSDKLPPFEGVKA